MDLKRYSTLVFDCDGVILDSNKVKTEAFYRAALPYGAQAAETLVEYHCRLGGISRYEKFEYFLQEIVGVPEEKNALEILLETYAQEVRKGLLACDVSPGLEPLRRATEQARWMVVSGGDQEEVRDIFVRRDLARYFEGGIFGSPDTKEEILEREKANDNITLPALFIGDSKYDHEAASREGLNFVFLSEWTEFREWEEYQQVHSFPAVPDLNGLLDEIS